MLLYRPKEREREPDRRSTKLHFRCSPTGFDKQRKELDASREHHWIVELMKNPEASFIAPDQTNRLEASNSHLVSDSDSWRREQQEKEREGPMGNCKASRMKRRMNHSENNPSLPVVGIGQLPSVRLCARE